MDAIDRTGLVGFVPVVVLENAEDALPADRALLEGGLPVMKITMRTKAAIECINKVRDNFPEMLLGAGTVRGVEQASEAVTAGAKFIVTPGFSSEALF